MNNVTKRGTVDARNGGAPYASWIAIVPLPDNPGNFSVDRAARALITRRFVRERLQGFSSDGSGGDPTVEILRCFDSRGSFRLFQQQSPGCHYHLVIFCGAADRLDATNFDTALPFRGYLPFATTLRRIRNRRLQRFRTASRFTRFDGRLRNIIRLHRNRAVR